MERKWYTKKIEYEGLPLYLRRPDYEDIFLYRDNFPNVLRVTQKLLDVKSNGLPESDYNASLTDFDGLMCKLFDKEDEGIIFLIETFAGKRHYYYFISDSDDYIKRIEKVMVVYPDIDIEAHSYRDEDWGFLKDYLTKLY